jgi:exportin-1
MATNEIQAAAQKLLGGDFDIQSLDLIVGAAYDPISPHRADANKALMQLQESPELWQMADGIIEQSQNPNCRFFGLQVLDDAIKTRYVKLYHIVFKINHVRNY